MELIRKIVKVGNSAGVIIPKEFEGGEAKVIVLKKPLDIKGDILKILMPYLESILGIYLVGSYARDEQTPRSDIDILVITSTIEKKFESGKYNIIMINKERVNQGLKKNILPLLPMIKEAKTILNSSLIKEYANSPIDINNLKFHIETTLSAMGVVKAEMDLCKSIEEKFVSNASAYSLVLRLRGVYIVRCLFDKKKYENKDFIALIKKITGSEDAYEGYLNIKDKTKEKKKTPLNEAEKLYHYIMIEIKQQEKWAKKKG